MTYVSPFTLPPGPERRSLMHARGLNISDLDFTEDEIAESQARTVEARAAMDERAREKAASS